MIEEVLMFFNDRRIQKVEMLDKLSDHQIDIGDISCKIFLIFQEKVQFIEGRPYHFKEFLFRFFKRFPFFFGVNKLNIPGIEIFEYSLCCGQSDLFSCIPAQKINSICFVA